MKKQSTVHRKNQPIQPETSSATFLGSVGSNPQPKGLFAHDRGKPTHLDAGAAESHTKPVEMPHHADTASANKGQSNAGRTNESQTAGSGGPGTRQH
jgi:hypothetical protein